MTPIWFINSLADVLTDGLVEMHTPSGDQPPLHVHRREDEGFYVLEGELCLWAGEERIVLRPGEFANAPAGVPHTYRVVSEEGARFLVTSPTGEFVRFVKSFGEPAPRRELPVPDGPPDAERLGRLAAEHGIDLLGPPGMLPADLAA
jgi:mannose-6-phosphate isomerase-like protein (cupin superfamily)